MEPGELDAWHMRRALEWRSWARAVEPNPMVGCVIVAGAEIIGEGWHRRFGGPHAEVEALKIAGPRAAGATMYVTLEPCCHQGKTPPCTRAVIAAGLRRVAVAQPTLSLGRWRRAERIAGGGDRGHGRIAGGGGPRAQCAHLKLLRTGRPWVFAKWAMTLDGRTATHNGSSRWISNARSREIVHALRGRVDAILVGRQTAQLDDPLLTARPAGPRTALRVVADTHGSLSPDSQLARTARDVPVMVAVGPQAPEVRCRQLSDAGCEVFRCQAESHGQRLLELLGELGRRRMTNVLVEGGGQLTGSLLDLGQIGRGPRLHRSQARWRRRR